MTKPEASGYDNKGMLLSAIINTYDRPGTLARCLEHLARMDAGDAVEVVVLDDGSPTDLRPVVEPFFARLPLRYERIEHAGYSAARNAGVRLARAPRVWFLGDDVMVPPSIWKRHAAVTDPHIALLGPYPMVGIEGSPPFQHWCEVNPLDDVADPQNARYAHFVTGNLSMDRALFLELGGFDVDYKAYGWEDLDLGVRFEAVGGRVAIDPEAAAVHEHPMTRRKELWRREWRKGINARRFHEKWKAHGAEFLEPVRLWPREGGWQAGPEWRLKLGDRLVGLLDAVAPDSALNWKLYERMVHACRARGYLEGAEAEYLHGIQ